MFYFHNSYYVNFFFYHCCVLNLLIMTTKEFLRRREYFRSLEIASKLFSSANFPFCSSSDFIFSCTIVTPCSRFTYYCIRPDSIEGCSIDDVRHFYSDVFTRLDFDVQFRYFVSFFNRCSKLQRSSVISSGDFDSLLSRFRDLYDLSRQV